MKQKEAFKTLFKKEVKRFTRIWTQTLLPPVVNQTLYLTIFGTIIGSKVGEIQGFSYIEFILPGLIMMAVILGTYSNIVSSFFGSKFQRSIEELMVAPVNKITILMGYAFSSMLRGLISGALVLLVSFVFAKPNLHSVSYLIGYSFFSSYIFAQAGFLNGIFAKKFDDVAIFPTFVLNPLIFFGGVFYSIESLNPTMQLISKFNPILYMIDGFRYGFLGIKGVQTLVSLLVMLGFCIALTIINLRLLNKGFGMKS